MLPPELDYLQAPLARRKLTPAQTFLERVQEAAEVERKRHLRHLRHLDSEMLSTPTTDGFLAELKVLCAYRAELLSPEEFSRFGSSRSGHLNVRQLLLLLDKHAAGALEQALAAANKLSKIDGVGYATLRRAEREDPPGTFDSGWPFDAMVQHHVINPAYLNWAKQAGDLVRSVQGKLRELLIKDARLHWDSNHGAHALWFADGGEPADPVTAALAGRWGPPRPTGAQKSEADKLAEMRAWRDKHDQAESDFAEELEKLTEVQKKAYGVMSARPFDTAKRPRIALESEGLPWTVYARWRGHSKLTFDTTPWPFPGKTAGKSGRLMAPAGWTRVATARIDLGELLRLPEGWQFASDAYDYIGAPEPTPAEADAWMSWMELTDAGLAMRSVGAALHELASAFHRRLRASDKQDVGRCWVCWRRTQRGKTLYCYLHSPESTVRADSDRLHAWAEHRHEAWEKALRALMTLNQPMTKVALSVTDAWNRFPPYRSHDPADKAAREGAQQPEKKDLLDLLDALQPLTQGEVDERLRTQFSQISKGCEGGIPPSAWEFHPVPFFTRYFCGPVKGPYPLQYLDRQHPLGVTRSKAGSSEDGHSVDRYLARDLMRDLLAQRVWLGLGGAAVDREAASRREGTKVTSSASTGYIPSAMQRRRGIDPGKAQDMKQAGSTNAEIARHFDVSRAAVTQFFNKL